MTKTLELIYDFGSPNAYFAYKALPEILARTGAQMRLVPALIGGVFKLTGNQPPWMAFSEVKGKIDYEMLEIQRFVARYGLEDYQFNPHFPVNTLMMMRAAMVAQDEGRLEAYTRAGFAAVWERGLKMDDPDVFATTMDEAGFDGAGLVARSQEQAVKDKLAAATDAVVARGVFGMPTMFVGDEMWFGKERLGQVEESLLV